MHNRGVLVLALIGLALGLVVGAITRQGHPSLHSGHKTLSQAGYEQAMRNGGR